MVLSVNDGALCRWSTSLPGVAMTTSGFLRNIATWLLLSSPPYWRRKKGRKNQKYVLLLLSQENVSEMLSFMNM